jgi:hypothetical protein
MGLSMIPVQILIKLQAINHGIKAQFFDME